MSYQKNSPITDFKMEQFLAGVLPENEMQEFRIREATDDVFAARTKMLREQNQKILTENPFENLNRNLDRIDSIGGALKEHSHINLLQVAAVLVVALGIFSAVFLGNQDKVAQVSENTAGMDVAMANDAGDIRIKGLQARMEVWKKSDVGIQQLQNMDNVEEGDEIQLRYSVPEKCYGVLFSMDGSGALTIHMGNDNEAIALTPGKMESLPYAYKLDDAPHFEKFFLLTSNKVFAVYAGKLDELLKQEGLNTVTFTLRKNGGI